MNITRLLGFVTKVYAYPGYWVTGLTEVTEVPGKGIGILQNSQKFRVLWHRRTELTEVPGRYKNAVPLPRVSVARAYRAYRNSGYGHECRTELTEVPGTGMNVLQNLQKFFVGYCSAIPGVNAPGMVLYVPYRTQPCNILVPHHLRKYIWTILSSSLHVVTQTRVDIADTPPLAANSRAPGTRLHFCRGISSAFSSLVAWRGAEHTHARRSLR